MIVLYDRGNIYNFSAALLQQGTREWAACPSCRRPWWSQEDQGLLPFECPGCREMTATMLYVLNAEKRVKSKAFLLASGVTEEDFLLVCQIMGWQSYEDAMKRGADDSMLV